MSKKKRKENSMKKIISLHVIVAMSLTIGSASLIEAFGNVNKYAPKNVKMNKGSVKKNHNATMHSIEDELHSIRHDFKENGDVSAANKRLDCIPAQIEQVVADMKNHEVHGKMWEVHEHTLNRKLRSARKLVNKSHEASEKPTKKSKSEKKRTASEKSVESKSAKRSKSTKKSRSANQESNNVTMKSIEHDLRNIRRNFKKDGDVNVANARLDNIPMQIEQVVADMQNHEKHGKMWEVHEHTLNRKLREARESVNK